MNESRRSGLGSAHGGFVLGAGGGIKVNRDAPWDENRGIVDVVKIASDAEEHRNGDEQDEEGDPTVFKPEASAR